MSIEQVHLSNASPVTDHSKLEHNNVLTFLDVPETNLSTADEHLGNCTEEHVNLRNENGTLGLNWEFGIAKLPGSQLQFRMDDKGDVVVLPKEEATPAKDESNVETDSNDMSVLSVCNENAETGLPFLENKTNEDVQTNKKRYDIKMEYDEKPFQPTIEHDHTVSNAIDKGVNRKEIYGHKDKVKCEFCKKEGTRGVFLGRFCSKTCIGKNAGKQRKLRFLANQALKLKRMHRDDMYTIDGSSTAEKGNLKMKIRLPSPMIKSKQNFYSERTLQSSYSKRLGSYERLHEPGTEFYLSFNWEEYLSSTKSTAVPPEAFEIYSGRTAFPKRNNPFKAGCFLEAIDPIHPYLICLTSVSEVVGHRLRLHFEGYMDCYDIWVNADSPFIFPCGFCETHERKLTVQGNVFESDFNWREYAKNRQSDFLSSKAFAEASFTNKTKCGIGEKLEAVDRKHHELICAATITDVIGSYVLVHFDGWEKEYDYWAHTSSPFIHPVGWCQRNGKSLSPPPDFDSSKTFHWENYLKETNSVMAPSDSFVSVADKFEVSTKLEVVDQRNPILVRVATIIEVTDLRLKVHFDGWSDIFDDWYDIDSMDIHPVNWCSKTSHPLQPPVNMKSGYKKSCPIEGCNGLGHANSPKTLTYHRKHHSEFGCPYSFNNFEKCGTYDRFRADFFGRDPASDSIYHSTGRKRRGGRRGRPARFSFSSGRHVEKRQGYRRVLSLNLDRSDNTSQLKKYQYATKERSERWYHPYKESNGRHSENAAASSLVSSLMSFTSTHLSQCWDKNVKLLPGVVGIKATDVLKWNTDRVALFVEQLTGKPECGKVFAREEVDGEALLLLTQNDISKVLGIKLGPAVKIYNAILFFKVSKNKDDLSLE